MIDKNKDEGLLIQAKSNPALLDRLISTILQSSLRRGDSVVEVGSEWGVFTWPILEIIGLSGQLWACEFSPAKIKNLLHKFKELGYVKGHIVPLLISDEDNLAVVYPDSDRPEDQQLLQAPSTSGSVATLTTRLDRIVPDTLDVSLILVRLRTKGHKAFLGSFNLIKRTRSPVIFQCAYNEELARGDINPETILQMLSDCEYGLTTIFGGDINSADDFQSPAPWYYLAYPIERSVLFKKVLERSLKLVFA